LKGEGFTVGISTKTQASATITKAKQKVPLCRGGEGQKGQERRSKSIVVKRERRA